MEYIPFNIENGEIVAPSLLPAYIAEVTWYGSIKQIRVGWDQARMKDRDHFQHEMLRQKRMFADHPKWRKQIKKLPRHRRDPSWIFRASLMYYPLPKYEGYWV